MLSRRWSPPATGPVNFGRGGDNRPYLRYIRVSIRRTNGPVGRLYSSSTECHVRRVEYGRETIRKKINTDQLTYTANRQTQIVHHEPVYPRFVRYKSENDPSQRVGDTQQSQQVTRMLRRYSFCGRLWLKNGKMPRGENNSGFSFLSEISVARATRIGGQKTLHAHRLLYKSIYIYTCARACVYIHR